MENLDQEGDLIARIARTLGKRVGGDLQAPTGLRGSRVLRLARDVAHAGERQQAPLAAYLVGRYVQMRQSSVGMAEADALAEATRDIARLTGSEDPGPA